MDSKQSNKQEVNVAENADDVPLPIEQVTPNQIQNTLLNFIKETRDNFSNLHGDGNHDYDLLQQVNQNLITLTGKVETLTFAVKKMTESARADSQTVKETVQIKVDEIKEEVAPKKIIVKEIPHFSFKLWWKSLFRRR